MHKLGDPKQDKKYQILEELELWLFGDSYLWKEGTDKQKRKATKPVKSWQPPDLSNPSRMIETLLTGQEEETDRIGLCGLCEIKLRTITFSHSKRSCELAMLIIWRMLNEPSFKYIHDA